MAYPRLWDNATKPYPCGQPFIPLGEENQLGEVSCSSVMAGIQTPTPMTKPPELKLKALNHSAMTPWSDTLIDWLATDQRWERGCNIDPTPSPT